MQEIDPFLELVVQMGDHSLYVSLICSSLAAMVDSAH